MKLTNILVAMNSSEQVLLWILALVAVVAANNLVAQPFDSLSLPEANRRYVAVRPSMFVLLREMDGQTFDREVSDLLICKAVNCLKHGEDCVLPAEFENIIVVEEEEYWTVSFRVRGNGKFARLEDGEIIMPRSYKLKNEIVYLDKESFEPIPLPEGAIRTAGRDSALTLPDLKVSYEDLNPVEEKLHEATD